ncbi:unnamed protein product [Candidula unifasciata]|uniref:RNA polymerase II subunit A C-terminal domain phosphatase n=1 Tax=Candidula unifasciata TaxID=100452 RepID=A0A8S3ZMS3_9EUPU|nr:unnamed protein product [Candidula unifasciata]
MVSKGSVLALYVEECDRLQKRKLKSKDSGLVTQVIVEEGAIVHPGDVLIVIHPQTDGTCTHPTIMKDMCADCGADLRREMGVAGDRNKSVTASVAMVHSIPELIISQEQALELGKEDENRLLRCKKLVLLVDLDQTLIHTTNDNIPPNLKGIKHFQLWHGKNHIWYHTKIRPFTQHFLEAVSKMYELHICTFGVRMYAHIIARFLDPDEKYFSHRILSRDECFDPLSKTANLKALFPCGDKMVGIIDDREDVWNHAPNLIHVKPYRFFQGTADINAPPGLTKAEHDNEPISHKVIDHSQQANDGKAEHGNEPISHKVIDHSQQANDGKAEHGNEPISHKVIDHSQQANDGKDSSSEKQHCQDCTDSDIKDRCGQVSDIRQGNRDHENVSDVIEIIEEPKNSVISQGDNKNDIVSSDFSVVSSKKTISEMNSSQCCEENEIQTSLCVGSGYIDTGDFTVSSEKRLVQSLTSANSLSIDNDMKNTGNIRVSLETSVMLSENCKHHDNSESKASGKTGSACNDAESQIEEVILGKENAQEEIEWTDDDDYLLHLEEILKKIHKAYYELYEQCQSNGSSELPDLKHIIPYVRKKTLKGANIVFTGMFPLNLSLEKSQAYIVARALGANVQNDIVPKKTNNGNSADATTHLVAAKPGTGKHKTALKMKGIHIVSPDWLWACNERWEWVPESLYPLISRDPSSRNMGSPDDSAPKSEKAAMRKRKNQEHKMEAIVDDKVSGNKRDYLEIARQNKKFKLDSDEFRGDSKTQPSSSNANTLPVETFSNSFNPLYSFSDEDIEFMDKEVEELLGEDDYSLVESDEEREMLLRQKVLGAVGESDSDSDSLSGDFPRGWKLRRKSFSPPRKIDTNDGEVATEDDDETENELMQFQKNMAAFAPDETESDSDVDTVSVGSVDDEIAEAVEKEFLASL